MTSRAPIQPLACVVLAAIGTTALARPDERIWNDPAGDAVARRTDTGANGPVRAGCTLPDLVQVRLAGWQSPTPATNPYAGTVTNPEDAHLFRLQLVLAGLVNPPGTNYFVGPGADPFEFGDSPLHGFVEINVDDDKDTGGETEPGARHRYLAAIARFGRTPYGSIGQRVAISADDFDGNFLTGPYFERSGADFVVSFCGCWATTIASGDANANGRFDPDETWIVRGRYFQRTGGYENASAAFGGTAPGLYDPPTNIRFAHESATDRTTITLIGALDMTGAAQLAGQGVQGVNLNVGDHTSVLEALQDLVNGAGGLYGTLSGPAWHLTHRWEGRDPEESLRVDRWEARSLLGTAYDQEEDAPFVWTDTGLAETPGDMDSDGLANSVDRGIVQQAIASLDGGPRDGDGVVNGSVAILDFGPNFYLYDVNADGLIDSADVGFYCPPDFNADGALNVLDYIAFQTGFALRDPRADFNGDGAFNVNDYIAFQTAFALGCS